MLLRTSQDLSKLVQGKNSDKMAAGLWQTKPHCCIWGVRSVCAV